MKPYYEADGITIYHADCREALPTLAAGSVDLVFTSPPYNLGNTTGGGFPAARAVRGHYPQGAGLAGRGDKMGKWSGGALAGGYGDYSDDLPHAEYVLWQQGVLLASWRLLSPSGGIFYNHKPRILGGRLVSPFDYIPDELRDNIRQVVIWRRAGGVNFSTAFYLPTHEWIVIVARPDFRLTSRGASGVGDVWEVAQESGTRHPAPFPLPLPLRAIETTPAATVLDPFAGSGTTLLAAKALGRRAVGIEIEERYCEMAARRLSQSVLPLMGLGGTS